MKFASKLVKKLKSKGKTIDPKVRICIECGSTIVYVNKKGIICRECGSTRQFKNKFSNPGFTVGDTVRIIDSEKNSKMLYKIKKIKKSEEKTNHYLLKSEFNDITLLYHESEKSHLKKITPKF